MTLRIEWGTIKAARAAGFEDLLALHWEEVEFEHEKVPLSVNWRAYADLEAKGILRLLLAWRGDRLVGYSAWFVQPPLHHSLTLWAVNDVLYLDPAERKGRAGIALIRRGEQLLKQLGVRVISYNVKPVRQRTDLGYKRGRDSVGHLLQRLGYSKVEEAYARYL